MGKLKPKFGNMAENIVKTINTRSPAVAEGPRDAGVPVEILSAAQM